jgi:hypothetical protein
LRIADPAVQLLLAENRAFAVWSATARVARVVCVPVTEVRSRNYCTFV